MIYLYRRIFKSQSAGTSTIAELLQSMFVAEMLMPEGNLWIVSPWISNVVLIDNRSGNFDALNPEWGRREVRLVDVLLALMSRGTTVNIVTRNDENNRGFIDRMQEMSYELALEHQLLITVRDKLHTKGVLLSNSLLMGSMNLTYFGMKINDESVDFSVDPADLASTRLEFKQYLEESHAGHTGT